MPAYDDTTGMMSSAPGALNVPAGILDNQGILDILKQLQSGEPSAAASRSARTQGLLQAALGVLGHSYTPYGHSGIEGVAQGLGQGLTGYQGELDRQKALVADKFKYAGLAVELQKHIALQQAQKDAAGGDPAKLAALDTLYKQTYPVAAATAALKPLGWGKPGEQYFGADRQPLASVAPKSDVMSPELFGQKQQLADIEARHQRELAAYKAGLTPEEQINLTPDATNMMAGQILTAQPTPALGTGKSAAKAREAAINEAGRQWAAAGGETGQIAVNKADIVANKNALNTLQQKYSVGTAAASGVDAGFKLIRETMGKIGNTGIPVIQEYINAGKQKTGDPNITVLHNAISETTSELAKIFSGATNSAGITDAGRAQAEGLMNAAQSPEQLEAAMRTAETMSKGRLAGYSTEMESRRGALRQIGKAPTAKQPTPAVSPRVMVPHPEGTLLAGPGGKQYVVKGGVPVPVQ